MSGGAPVRNIVPWIVLLAASVAHADDTARAAFAARAADLAKADAAALKGADGYYFLTSDLRHYGLGPFWGDAAARAAVAEKDQDPLPAILDFHAQCTRAGARLIVVPVPGKASLYPDKLGIKAPAAGRIDASDQAFYDLLRKAGIEVLDLTPAMLDLRRQGVDSHCRQDTHWSPASVNATATLIAATIKRDPWYAAVPRKPAKVVPVAVSSTGDLVALLDEKGVAPEKLTIEQVTLDGQPIASDRASPVLLIGDSHTLVFHEPINGGIEASAAGLPDHLAALLGFAPDLVGALGGGANASRIDLARRKDGLAGKEVVIWCFAAREFTEALQGWLTVPVVPR